jgi:hypothetical protein
MRRIGFSTGALAKGDFQEGIRLQEVHPDAEALELSALREDELDALIKALPSINLGKYRYVSVHAPSKRLHLSETELVDKLQKLTTYVPSIVVHPDVIEDINIWKRLEQFVVLENMDQRKPIARTAIEMKKYFDALPNARFCFDIGHARQVDPTLSVAVELLLAYSDRLAEVHISEVDAASRHVAISTMAMKSYQRIASLIPKDIPVIVESSVTSDSFQEEINMALASLGDRVFSSELVGSDGKSAY